MYRDILDDYVSPRDVKIRKFSLPWINSELLKAINNRYKLLRACDGSSLTTDTWAKYRHARNEVTKLMHKAEAFYRKERLPSSKTLSLSERLCVMPLENTGPTKSEP